MKIIVCVKIIPDITILKFDPETRSFDHDDFVYMINPADLVALKFALDIKEKTGSGKILCLSMGPSSVTKHLRACLAMGSDEAVRLWDQRFADSDGLATAEILSAAVKKTGFDLILCGRSAQDSDNGITGPAMAALLDIPHVSAIDLLEIREASRSAKIHRMLERGEKEVLECSLPALFTVHPTMKYPPYPSFPSSLTALRKEIPAWDMKELDLREEQIGKRGSLTTIVDFELPKPRPKVKLRIDSNLSPEERMKLLISGGKSEKKDGFLEGEPRDLAEKILKIINERKKQIRSG